MFARVGGSESFLAVQESQRQKGSGMSIDPEILLGLQNSSQNQSSISLQKQILNMQKLQVLNQIRISEGLPPLAELPKPPPPEPELEPPASVKQVVVFSTLLFLIIFVVVYFAWRGISPWK